MSLHELVDFLSCDSKPARCEAAKLLLGLSEEESVRNFLRKEGKKCYNSLINIAGGDDMEAAEAALSALVNLSGDQTIAEQLGTVGFVTSICECLQERHLLGPAKLEYYLSALLANVTRERQGVESLLERDFLLWRILSYYGDAITAIPEIEVKDKSASIGSILVNITTSKAGRLWFINQDMSLWETFSLQTKIASRRPVVLQAIKNVCCDADLIDEVDYDKVPVLIVLGRLLFPPASVLDDLAKAEDRVEEKFRAVVPSVISDSALGLVSDLFSRELVAECLVALFRHKKAREAARKLEFYEIFRVWHSLETDNQLKTVNEDIVHLVHYTEQELEDQDRQGGHILP